MRKWTYLDVVTTMNRDKISKLAVERSGSPAGSPLYIRAYKGACSEFEKGLSESQRRMYRVKAKEWSEKKLPARMQQRYVHGNGSSG